MPTSPIGLPPARGLAEHQLADTITLPDATAGADGPSALTVTLVWNTILAAGSLRADTVEQLLVTIDLLTARGMADVAVDLDEVDFVDRTAVVALAAAQRRAVGAGRLLRIQTESVLLSLMLSGCELEPSTDKGASDLDGQTSVRHWGAPWSVRQAHHHRRGRTQRRTAARAT